MSQRLSFDDIVVFSSWKKRSRLFLNVFSLILEEIALKNYDFLFVYPLVN